MQFNLKGINKESIINVSLLILALINSTLQMFGINTLPIENEALTSIISTLFLVITALWNTWKNRNFTEASQTAQEVLNAIKQGVVLAEEISEIIRDFKDKDEE